ncbi:MAG: bifunctional homocysteine S-methyltransferase/methylenetetrahydrofolate reductase [Pseudomonadota bacterium]
MSGADRFRNKIKSGVVLFDGAMGTMLYSKGVFINTCYDELNLVRPELIKNIHEEYVAAGADVIETNTFGANPIKLKPFGLADRLREINLAGARIARDAAGDRALVAGAVGPLGLKIEPLGPTSVDEARDYFRAQIEALVEGGVDLLVFETFGDLTELQQALRGAREVCDLPVVAQITVDETGHTIQGAPAERCAVVLEKWGADVVGINCSVGPEPTLAAIERMVLVCNAPLSAQPNAGVPRAVEGRNLYMSSPEYFAEYAKRFVAAGVHVLGGCCGTTPAYIRAMRNAVRALQPQRGHTGQIAVGDLQDARDPLPLAERSNLGRKLDAGEFVTLVEFTPPRGPNVEKVIQGVRAVAKQVDAINIPDGPRASARMSPLALGVLIQQQVGIEVVLHYTCRDRNLLGIQSDLLGASALGIHNLLLITGDPPKLGNYPDATAVFDVDAIGLTHIVNWLNHGLDVARNAIGGQTGFVFGVGVNPGALKLDHEIRRFEYKVEAGAEYAITQPVFDVAQLESFLTRTRHCRVPVLAGIWPLTSLRNAEFMRNEVPGAFVPDDIMARMARAEDQARAREEGLLVAREILQAVRPLVQGVQLSVPMGKYNRVLDLLTETGDRA